MSAQPGAFIPPRLHATIASVPASLITKAVEQMMGTLAVMEDVRLKYRVSQLNSSKELQQWYVNC